MSDRELPANRQELPAKAAELPADPRPGALLCGRCNAVVAAWRVAERGGTCHCCGEQIDARGGP